MPKALSEIEREKFLADKHLAVLSVAATDGRPPASVPIWYDYEPGGTIRITTGRDRRKARLIEQAGVVTIVVHREELPYQHVVVEGTVVDATTPSPHSARAAIAARYLGAENAEALAQQSDGTNSVLFTIRPDRWLTADFSDDF